MTYMLSVPMVMWGAFLSLSASTSRSCCFAGASATRKSSGKPPGGGSSCTLLASRCRMSKCAALFPLRRILLSAAVPKELSPGCSHSSPVSESQPAGFKRSLTCSTRQAAISCSQFLSWASAGAASSAERITSERSLSERRLVSIQKLYRGPGGRAVVERPACAERHSTKYLPPEHHHLLLLRVVKNDPQGVPRTAMHPADAMPQINAIVPARPFHWPVSRRENNRLTLIPAHHLRF